MNQRSKQTADKNWTFSMNRYGKGYGTMKRRFHIFRALEKLYRPKKLCNRYSRKNQ